MRGRTFGGWLGLVLILSLNALAAAQTQKIDELLKTYHKKGEFSGAVLVARGDQIIYKGAVGPANREWNIPNSTATRFRINSITKQFTSLLLMQLVEEGRVNLEAPVSDYLPAFRKDTGEKIKIRDLLMSASGLPALEDERLYRDTAAEFTDLGFIIKNYLSGDLIFEPGTKFNYNNGDFIVLGAIIERVTGKTFERVLQEKILRPLGMKNTGLVKSEEIIENLAGGYIFRDGKYYNEPFFSIENFGPAGAMYSTLDDMFRWDKALIGNELLSKKNTEIMFTASPRLGFVALGSWVYELKLSDGKSYKLIERQGGIGGFSSLNLIAPDEKLSLVFLGNTETDALFRTYAKQGLSFEVLRVLAEN